jgi:predicted RNase H-like nuclease
MSVVGIDGCRGGWIAVAIHDDGKREVTILESISSLPELGAEMALIDIPIGLPETRYRACDLAAREKLQTARSRVFLGTRRPLLKYITDYRAANIWEKSDGKGLSKQSFSILPKILQVDDFMSPDRQRFVRETHPELIFQRLNGGVPVSSKKRTEGKNQRQALLSAQGFDALPTWLCAFPRRIVQPDDLFDACACALAAQAIMNGHGNLLACREENDAKGLRMEMWF